MSIRVEQQTQPDIRGETGYSAAPQRLSLALLPLVLLWLVDVVLLAVGLRIDTRPPGWDDSVFLLITEAWRRALLDGSPAEFIGALRMSAWKAPPLWTLLVAAGQLAWGTDVDRTTLVSNGVALAILALAVFAIGRRLFGRVAGAVATALTLLSSGIVLLAHVYLLDVPLVAMVALAAVGLVRLAGAARPRDLALAALLVGLACATRYQAVLALWAPVAVVLLQRWQRDRRDGASHLSASRRALLSGGLLAATALLVVGGTLLAAATNPLDPPPGSSRGAYMPANRPYTAAAWLPLLWRVPLFYVQHWPTNELHDQPELIALGCFGALVCLIWMRDRALFLLAWLIGTWLALAPFWPDWRYDVSTLPAFSLLASAPLAVIERRSRAWRTPVARLTLLIGVSVYAAFTLAWQEFGLRSPVQLPEVFRAGWSAPPAPSRPTADLLDASRPELPWPRADDWQDGEIVRRLRVAPGVLGLERLHVAFLPALMQFQPDSYIYSLQVAGAPVAIETADWGEDDPYSVRRMRLVDAIVAKTGSAIAVVGPTSARRQAFVERLLDPTSALGQDIAARFAVASRHPLPDGSEAVLLVRRPLLSSFDAVRDLPRAQMASDLDAEDLPAAVSATLADVRGDLRPALFEHPPAGGTTSVAYRLAALPPRATLMLGMALRPECWDSPGDGVQFRVVAVDAGREALLLDRYVDPKHRPEDRRWIDESLSLAGYAGRPIELRFETLAGPADDNTWDWAVWSEPFIIPLDESRLARLGG